MSVPDRSTAVKLGWSVLTVVADEQYGTDINWRTSQFRVGVVNVSVAGAKIGAKLKWTRLDS